MTQPALLPASRAAPPLPPKKVYTREFKRETWRLLQSSGRPKADLERDLGLYPGQIRLWQRAMGRNIDPYAAAIMRLGVPVIAKAAPALITQDQFKMLRGGSPTRDTRPAKWGGFARPPFVAALRLGLKAPPPSPARKTRQARHA
jgi:hypothetical protein